MITAVPRGGRSRRLVGVLVPLVLALTGCVRMPTSGPVTERGPVQQSTVAAGIDIDPLPPQPGDTPAEIVRGFLDAMLATPLQTRSAQAFLARAAQASWDPGHSTLVYTSTSVPEGDAEVSVELVHAHRLDSDGVWRGPATPAEQHLAFPMVREEGQWRIAEAPDALIVPQSWFESRFVSLALYFFDSAARMLVPQPVFVPRGQQLATSLVRGLVRGPSPELGGVVRSFLSGGVDEGLSVPVRDGVAEVALTGEAPTTQRGVKLLTSQLAWTLRQDPAVRSVRVVFDGRVLRLSGGRTAFPVDTGPEFDPAGHETNRSLYALVDDRLVSAPLGTSADLRPDSGPLGSRGYGTREVAVSLNGDRAALVSQDGRRLTLGPVGGDGAVVVPVTGSELLRPAWDGSDRLWLVDRAGGQARVSYLVPGGSERHDLVVPGVTGQDVRRLLVSRDGTRLVAVVHGPAVDRIVVSRIRTDDESRIMGATQAVTISDASDGALRVRDVAWQSPTALLVLHQFADTAQIRTIAIDGTTLGAEAVTTTVPERVLGLVSSPVPSQGVYAHVPGRLIGIAGEARDTQLPPGTAGPAMVG